jgi:hypothetical protein
VIRFDREAMRGYVNAQTYLQPGGIEVLSPDGGVAVVPFRQVKAVCFVKDWDGKPVFSERKEFLGRPKSAGLWIGLKLRDGDRLEGLIANDLLQIEPAGYSLTPPEATGNTNRVFLPREAVAEIKVLGVVGSPLRGRRERAQPAAPEEQISLFAED